jgi:phosphatidylinositol glycan class O
MALQLFFCSGHFCEFSGLQYASAFIGFDDMLMYSSGSLLLINTCGFFFLGPLSLPVFVACSYTPPVGAASEGSEEAGKVATGCAGHQQSTNSNDVASLSDKTGPGAALRQQFECGLWVINCIRFAALVVSLVSAAVQQQHILLWAIFAPKLVFELWFMLVTAAGELLVAGLLPHFLV